jgi:hypothetical protein
MKKPKGLSSFTLDLSSDDLLTSDDLTELLGECPPEGHRHAHIPVKARMLARAHYDDDETVDLLMEYFDYDESRRPEVERDVAKVFSDLDSGYVENFSGSKQPPVVIDFDRVEQLYRTYGGLYELGDYLNNACGMPDDIMQLSTKDYLCHLYQPDDLLCLSSSPYGTYVAKRDYWFQFHDLCFLVPNPFCWYRPRSREKDNIERRRFYNLEFDITELNEKDEPTVWAPLIQRLRLSDYTRHTGKNLQAAVILYLFDQGYPIRSITDSGNKSLHVLCSNSDLSFERLFTPTLSIGVDPHGRCESQFMRVVNPTHPERPQRCIYLS